MQLLRYIQQGHINYFLGALLSQCSHMAVLSLVLWPLPSPCLSRSGDVIEPLLRKQWFVRCEEMAKKAIEVSWP